MGDLEAAVSAVGPYISGGTVTEFSGFFQVGRLAYGRNEAELVPGKCH